MEKGADYKEPDQGELLEQLSQLRNELARKQRKLKKCRRSEKVKAHVKLKIQEQALLNGNMAENDLDQSSLSSTLVSNSSALNNSFDDTCSHVPCSDDKYTTDTALTLRSQEKANTKRRLSGKNLTEKGFELMDQDGNRSDKNETDVCMIRGSGDTEDISNFHSKNGANKILKVKDNKSIVASHKQESLKLNHDSRQSGSSSELDKNKNDESKTDKKPEVSVSKLNNQNDSGSRSRSLERDHKIIFKSPTSTNDKLVSISPDILSGESSSEEICHLKEKLKDDSRFVADALLVTPSFVSSRTLSQGQDLLHEDSMKPWHFDSELTDIKLTLNFDSETQHVDDLSTKDHIFHPRNNSAVKDSTNVQSLTESQSKVTNVQTNGNMANTSMLLYASKTKLLNQKTSTAVPSVCKSVHEKEVAIGKSRFENDLHGTDKVKGHCSGSSSHSKAMSHLSISTDSLSQLEVQSGKYLKMESGDNSSIDNNELPEHVDKNLNSFKKSPFHYDKDIQKGQTTSLSSVFSHMSSQASRHLSITRKRRRSNSFSDLSGRKIFKDLDDYSMKSCSSEERSDCDKSRNIQHGFTKNIDEYLDSPNIKNLNKIANKSLAETESEVCTISSSVNINHNSTVINNINSIVANNSKTEVVNISDRANLNTDSTEVGSTKETGYTVESSESDTSDSSSSPSLLRPVLSVTKSQKIDIPVVEPVSECLNNNGKVLCVPGPKRTCVEGNGLFRSLSVDGTGHLDNEKTQKLFDAERGPSSPNTKSKDMQAGSLGTEESSSSSDETIKIVQENYSENKNEAKKSTENYLDFTELDVVPFSQMELSESFLSDPEAYQIERMKGFCRGRKKQEGIFVKRKSPRLTTGIANILDGHNSLSFSSLSSSGTEQLVPSRRCKSRKSLMISSLFQFLVDEIKRKKSEEEFCLPQIQYGYLVKAKCSETQTEASESVLKELTETSSLSLVQESSEELYSQEYSKDLKHTVSDVCGTDNHKLLCENPLGNLHVNVNSDKLETKHGLAKYCDIDVASTKLSPYIKADHDQVQVSQRQNLCNGERKASQSSLEEVSSSSNNCENVEPCGFPTTVTAISSVSSPKSKIGSPATSLCGITTCQPAQSEVCMLSPDRGSVHGDASLPVDCLSSHNPSELYKSPQSSVKTGNSSQSPSELCKLPQSSLKNAKSSQSSSENCNSSQSSSETFSDVLGKPQGKDCLTHLSCFQTGRDEPILSLVAGSVMLETQVNHFVVCLSEYTLSLWSSAGLDEWTSDLDWLLPLGCCAKNLWLLPHETKTALLISGVKSDTVSWLLLFVYHWQTGESSRHSLHLPLAGLTRTSLLCCPLPANQVVLSCDQPDGTRLEKYFLTDSLEKVTSHQSLEETKHKLLSLAMVEDLDPALVGLTSDSHILVWNHKVGTILTRIDVSLILPTPLSLASVQAVKGYLLLLIMNRSSEKPGCFLAVNAHIGMCTQLFHYDTHREGVQSFKQSMISNKILAAVDENGDIVMWDKYHGNILVHLPQSHTTALHISNSLLIAGQENGCVHVMQIR